MCCNAERRWRFVLFESSGCYLQGKRIINPLDIVTYFSQIISFLTHAAPADLHRTFRSLAEGKSKRSAVHILRFLRCLRENQIFSVKKELFALICQSSYNIFFIMRFP